MAHPTAKCTDVLECSMFLAVAQAGYAHASWCWVAVAMLALFLTGLSRWQDLIVKAAGVDARYRELGRLAFANRLVGTGIVMYGKAWSVVLVVGTKLVQDAVSLGAAFTVGRIVAKL